MSVLSESSLIRTGRKKKLMESHPGNKYSFDTARFAFLLMKISLITGYPEEPLFNFY